MGAGNEKKGFVFLWMVRIGYMNKHGFLYRAEDDVVRVCGLRVCCDDLFFILDLLRGEIR